MGLRTIIESYFKDIESGLTAEHIAKYYASGATQTEFPNLVAPKMSQSEIGSVSTASNKGKGVLSSQKIDIIRTFEQGNTIIVEATWTGKVALPIGQIPIGGELKAHIARFYEFEGDKIVAQRNYDCFEQF